MRDPHKDTTRRLAILAITLTLALAVGFVGCDKKDTPNGDQKMQKVEKETWGKIGEKDILLYTLTNKNGLVMKVTNYGAIVTQLHVPDKKGNMADIVLGFDKLEGYQGEHNPYFGCIAGRYANRIKVGKFKIDDTEHELTAKNNMGNHLHGGKVGFDKKVWTITEAKTTEGPAVQLTLTSPDGDEGYPGTLKVTVVYTLTNNNEFKVEMTATTDKPTVLNLAQHTYWNLAGHDSGTVLDQEIMLHCDKYTPADDTLITTGEIKDVKGTAFDLTKPEKIGAEIGEFKKGKVGESTGGGYDWNYVVNGKPNELRPVAVVHDPKSGRVMELSADQPGVMFYTGNWLDPKKVIGKGGKGYPQHGGFCLETQVYPDSPNKVGQPGWPSPILRPGETYKHTMVHKFSTR